LIEKLKAQQIINDKTENTLIEIQKLLTYKFKDLEVKLYEFQEKSQNEGNYALTDFLNKSIIARYAPILESLLKDGKVVKDLNIPDATRPSKYQSQLILP
jgi:hypothetical protein